MSANTIYIDKPTSTGVIQSALDSLTGGGIVHLGPGTYTTSAPLTISNNNVTLRGSGKNATIILNTNINQDIITISKSRCWVEDLAVFGIDPTTASNGSASTSGTGRGIVFASALGTHLSLSGCRNVEVTCTPSWGIYDSGLSTFTTTSNNWTTPLAASGFDITIGLTLEDCDIAFWGTNGALFIGSGAAYPRIKRLKTNGYSYNTYTQVTGAGATPTNDMGSVFLYNVYGAVLEDCYFQSPTDNTTLPNKDACMLSFLSCHSCAVTSPKFEVLDTTCNDSNGGNGGRQYAFITACNSYALSVTDADFQSHVTDGASTLSNYGLKIIRTSDEPSAVGISFIRGVANHTRTTGGASGAKENGQPVTWDRNDFLFCGEKDAIDDGTSTGARILIEDFNIVNASTGLRREPTTAISSFTIANCTTGGGASVNLSTTTGDFSNVNNGDTIKSGGVTIARVLYLKTTTTLTMDTSVNVVAGTTLQFGAGANCERAADVIRQPCFHVRERRTGTRMGSASSCDLTGAGGPTDFYSRWALSHIVRSGVMGYVSSGDETDGLWITTTLDNQPRLVPFYRKRNSNWSNPQVGDMNYRTDKENFCVYNATNTQFETYVKSTTDPSLTGNGAPDFKDNTFRVSDDGDTTKKLALQCSGIATASTRTLAVKDFSSAVVVVGNAASASGTLGAISLTGQIGNLGTQTLLTGTANTAGLYRVSFYVKTTTAVAASTMTVTASWNDGTAQTLVVPFENATVIFNNHDLATNNAFSQGSIVVSAAASQNVTFITTVTSAGSPVYSIAGRIEALG